MTEPNLAPDLLRKITDLERRIYELERRRLPAATADTGDGFWKDTAGTLSPNPTADAPINYLEIELEDAQVAGPGTGDLHHTYLYVDPGINAGGADIEAETYNPGHGNAMDWFFWARRGTGTRHWEAGSFWDAIADDEAGVHPECFFEVYADGQGAYGEMASLAGSGIGAEVDVNADKAGGTGHHPGYGYVDTFANWVVFQGYASSGTQNMEVIPDAELISRYNGALSFGWDGVDTVTIKGLPSAGGTIVSTTLTLT